MTADLARRPGPTAALALLAAMAGCADEHEYDHNNDHDHDRVAHVDLDHRPSDFPDAVARLLAGHDATREALSAGRLDEVHDELLPIQRDLARWLPEVAADSDMPEAPWNRVDAISSRLLAAYDSAHAGLHAGQAVGGDRLAPAEAALDDLRRLRDEADPAWFPRLGAEVEEEGDATEGGPGRAETVAEDGGERGD